MTLEQYFEEHGYDGYENEESERKCECPCCGDMFAESELIDEYETENFTFWLDKRMCVECAAAECVEG